MKTCAVLVGLMLACVALGTAAQTSPDLDCTNPTTLREKAACYNREGAEVTEAYRRMGETYQHLLKSLVTEAARDHLQRDQEAWLEDLRRLCMPPRPTPLGGDHGACQKRIGTVRDKRLAAMPGGVDYPYIAERRIIAGQQRARVHYRIDVSYPVFELVRVDYKEANTVIKGWADKFAAELVPPPNEDGRIPIVRWFLESGHVIHVVAGKLATVDAYWRTYKGEADSDSGRIAWHVDLTTGRLLDVDEILDRTSGWKEGVAHRVRNDLKRRLEAGPEVDEALGTGALARLVADGRRWIFARDKVILTFNAPEIGPHVGGPYEVELSYEQLATYVRKDGPLGRIAR